MIITIDAEKGSDKISFHDKNIQLGYKRNIFQRNKGYI